MDSDNVNDGSTPSTSTCGDNDNVDDESTPSINTCGEWIFTFVNATYNRIISSIM